MKRWIVVCFALGCGGAESMSMDEPLEDATVAVRPGVTVDGGSDTVGDVLGDADDAGVDVEPECAVEGSACRRGECHEDRSGGTNFICRSGRCVEEEAKCPDFCLNDLYACDAVCKIWSDDTVHCEVADSCPQCPTMCVGEGVCE